jgi:nucleolar protein 16
MGRELQKKKNRSSLPKKRQNGKSKKKILQNPIIAKHWYARPTHVLIFLSNKEQEPA